MKRLLPLLLAFLLLTGCGPRTPTEEPAAPEQLPVQEIQEEPAPEPEPEPETLDLETVAVENAPGFYDLTALPQLEGVCISTAALVDENTVALLTGDRGDTVCLLHLETGALEELCTLPLEGEENWSSGSFQWAEPLVAWDNVQEVGYVVREDGSYISTPPMEDRYINSWYCMFAEDACYWFDPEQDYIWKNAYGAEEWEPLGAIPGEYYYPSLSGLTADGTGAVLTAYPMLDDEEVTLVFSLTTGEVTAAYKGTACAGELTGTVQTDVSSYPDSEIPGSGAQEDEGIRAEDNALTPLLLSCQRPGERVECTFDLEWVNREGISLTIDGNWIETLHQGPVWGRSLFGAWADQYHLLLWDYRDVTPQEVPSAELAPYEPPVYEDMGELTERAEAMEAQYGVQIYLGEEAVNAPFPDYTLEACKDEQAVSAALDVLESALSCYPEGYLEQLGGDSVRTICFCLSGRMTPVDPSVSIDDPGGLSCQVDGMELIAFNANGYVRVQDVIHELTHVLDHWLWERENLDEVAWSAMNPEDFSYYYGYINENGESYEWAGSTDYTTWGVDYYSGAVDNIYFIDPYSTTYPTEDRARLMEYLLADPENGPEAYFSGVHLQEKLTYYFQCIRETFDTTGWPEQTAWEAALAKMAPAQLETEG